MEIKDHTFALEEKGKYAKKIEHKLNEATFID
jgi:hypothetical protein